MKADAKGKNRMIERFEGPTNLPNVIDALVRQQIVGGDKAFAERLASVGHPVAFDAGDTIIEQDGDDTDAYFILSGDVEIFVNTRLMSTRKSGEAIGEMAAIDPAVRRSATNKAATSVVVWKVSASDLLGVAEEAQNFWKNVARVLAERLRERAKHHRPANRTPIMFLGSSVEGLGLAKAIESSFKHAKVVVRAWYNGGVFTGSNYTMDDLMTQVENCDFAMFVFGPDDKIASRGEDYVGPRDNVILELGLFAGKLGRQRVFIVQEFGSDLKIPTDLTGIQPVTYVCKPGCTPQDMLGSVRNEIEDNIRRLGAL